MHPDVPGIDTEFALRQPGAAAPAVSVDEFEIERQNVGLIGDAVTGAYGLAIGQQGLCGLIGHGQSIDVQHRIAKPCPHQLIADVVHIGKWFISQVRQAVRPQCGKHEQPVFSKRARDFGENGQWVG